MKVSYLNWDTIKYFGLQLKSLQDKKVMINLACNHILSVGNQVCCCESCTESIWFAGIVHIEDSVVQVQGFNWRFQCCPT